MNLSYFPCQSSELDINTLIFVYKYTIYKYISYKNYHKLDKDLPTTLRLVLFSILILSSFSLFADDDIYVAKEKDQYSSNKESLF